ncbi:hypothetical protein ACPEEZ_14415 [Frigoribacterium sp. 2-23]|uniref:hypothetical protein n=1 Tax=Frigoribacterium sp. 2-23 TaxID=3415006 RepID=UPI003C705DB8
MNPDTTAPTPDDEEARLLIAALVTICAEERALPVIRGGLASRLVDGGLSPVRVAARLGVRRVIVRSWLRAWTESTEESREAAGEFAPAFTSADELEVLTSLKGRSVTLRRERGEFARAAVEAGVAVEVLADAVGRTPAAVRVWLR